MLLEIFSHIKIIHYKIIPQKLLLLDCSNLVHECCPKCSVFLWCCWVDITGTFRRLLEELCFWADLLYISVTNLCWNLFNIILLKLVFISLVERSYRLDISMTLYLTVSLVFINLFFITTTDNSSFEKYEERTEKIFSSGYPHRCTARSAGYSWGSASHFPSSKCTWSLPHSSKHQP